MKIARTLALAVLVALTVLWLPAIAQAGGGRPGHGGGHGRPGWSYGHGGGGYRLPYGRPYHGWKPYPYYGYYGRYGYGYYGGYGGYYGGYGGYAYRPIAPLYPIRPYVYPPVAYLTIPSAVYWPPASYSYVAAAVPSATHPETRPAEVVYPNGKYVLSGDGVNAPYRWVWIPNPPAPPATGEPERPAQR